MRTAIHGFSPIDNLAEAWRELLVRCIARSPEGIPADLWDCVIVQMGYAGARQYWLAW
jgi:hypothetical protein